MRPVAKSAENTHTRSFYARADAIKAMLDPILVSNGFSYSISSADCPLADHMRFALTVRHLGGHSEVHFMDAQSDAVGPKGGGTKTLMQGIASAYTYCERHLICKVFGVQLVSDDDGNAAGGVGVNVEPVSRDQTTHLNDLMNEVLTGAQKGQLLNVLKIDDISQLPKTKYEYAVGLIEGKRK